MTTMDYEPTRAQTVSGKTSIETDDTKANSLLVFVL